MGCVVSTAIACLLCNNRCSVERLASKMAFHPPSPPSYTIETDSEGSSNLKFAHVEMNQASALLRGSVVRVEVCLLVTSRKEQIPVFHFKYPGAKVRPPHAGSRYVEEGCSSPDVDRSRSMSQLYGRCT